MKRTAFLGLTLFAISCSIPRLETAPTENGVRFVLKAPNASRVAVVGNFNRWSPEKDLLTGPDGDGLWSGIVQLAPGRYEYLFLVDDANWTTDPAVSSVDDGMGRVNSVIRVESPH